MSSMGSFYAVAFAFIYVASLLFTFREYLTKGVVVTPLLIVHAFILVRVAPPFVLPYAALSKDQYPLLVLTVAVAALSIGYAVTPNIRLRPSITSASPDVLWKETYTFPIILLSLFLVALGLYFYRGLPTTVHAVTELFSGDNIKALTKQLKAERLALTKGAYFGQEYRGQGVIMAIERVGWSMVMAYFAAQFARQIKWKNLVLLVTSIFFAWIFIAGTGTREPFLLAVLTIVVSYSLVRRIPFPFLLTIVACLLVIGIFLGSYTAKMNSLLTGSNIQILSAFERFGDRLLFGNGANDIRIIELSRDGVMNSPIGYYNFRNLIAALPGVNYGMPLSYDLNVALGGKSTTFQSGTYLSVAYVDFGLIGVAISYMIIGAITKLFHFNIFRQPLGPVSTVVAAVLIMQLSSLIMSGPHALITSSVVLAVLTGLVLAFRNGFSGVRRILGSRDKFVDYL